MVFVLTDGVRQLESLGLTAEKLEFSGFKECPIRGGGEKGKGGDGLLTSLFQEASTASADNRFLKCSSSKNSDSQILGRELYLLVGQPSCRKTSGIAYTESAEGEGLTHGPALV